MQIAQLQVCALNQEASSVEIKTVELYIDQGKLVNNLWY